MTQLNWLHISDIHIRTEDFDRNVVWTAFLDDISSRERKIDSRLGKIDFVFITGDLVFSGQEDEYELAYQELIVPLAEELQISNISEQIFLVPGNHDIDRNRIGVVGKSIRYMLNEQNAREPVRDLLLDNTEFQQLLRAQVAYFNFFADTFDSIQIQEPGNYYVHKINIGESRKVAIVGLNSAWLAYGGDEDRGRLLLGEPQVVKALESCTENDIVICLQHHSFDWFNPNNPDTTQCKSRLMERCDLILHGHLHTPNFMETSSLEGETIVIPAGAIFTKRNAPLSYNFVTCDSDSGASTVFFRKYSDTRREWIKDIELTGDESDGKKNFTIESFKREVDKSALAVSENMVESSSDFEDEEGFIDWAVRMMDGIEKVAELLQESGTVAETLTAKTELAVERVKNANNDPRRINVIAIRLSNSMEDFADKLREISGDIQMNWASFYDAFLPFVSLKSDDFRRWLSSSDGVDSYIEQAMELATTVELSQRKVGTLSASIISARTQLIQLRGISRSINKAVRRVDNSMTHYEEVLDQIEEDMLDIAMTARQLPETISRLLADSNTDIE